MVRILVQDPGNADEQLGLYGCMTQVPSRGKTGKPCLPD